MKSLWLKLKKLMIGNRECDHIYFPVPGANGPIGQECSICGKFNSLKDLGL